MRPIVFTLLGVLAVLTSSCAYARNRWADAKDIFTVGVGNGIGGIARVGPVQAGLGVTVDGPALSNGEASTGGVGERYSRPHRRAVLGSLVVYGANANNAGEQRGKNYSVKHLLVPISADHWPSPAYYTQIEVSAGAICSVHVGFNPGELVDFLLGFVGIDIYHDDVVRDEPTRPTDAPSTSRNLDAGVADPAR